MIFIPVNIDENLCKREITSLRIRLHSTRRQTSLFMKKAYLMALFVLMATNSVAQTAHEYEISFQNAVHHEAKIVATFTNLDATPLEVRMSRTSPGRYAIHNFAKNVYAVKAFDSMGNPLAISRPNPQQWDVSGHDGTVRFEYLLFANRGDGTYSQIDETHAHLNIPATFVYARAYQHRPIRIHFDIREDLNWQVATQLKRESEFTYFAPDLDYFMDSPVEIADYHLREEMVDNQLIRLALHSPANDNEVNEYFSKVMAIVRTQRDVFGELPKFDFGEYTFLACYMPNASGDGMEHRNSTIITNRKPLDEPLGETSIGTVSHEFFHAWNVERIRPASLEPFDFEEANMSGELWFAEGFTSYYTGLTLARAGIISHNEYIEGLAGSINRVYNAPGLQFFNAIEMSYRAPFVDASTSIDPTNNINTFVSYYTYGSVLGLALDLSLRNLEGNKSLDEFFRIIWRTYGKAEIPYHIKDIEAKLAEYTSEDFAQSFFNNYIYQTNMPDFNQLFESVGVDFRQEDVRKADLGGEIVEENGAFRLATNARIGSALYEAGIEQTDEIITIAGNTLESGERVEEILSNRRAGQTITVEFNRWGVPKTARVRLSADPSFITVPVPRATREQLQRRTSWLNSN